VIQDEIQQPGHAQHDWRLAFQKVRYVFENGETKDGYRFIWYRPDGTLQAARGQARIESIEQAGWFIQKARERGWQ
jgi:hypothetical protein